MLQPPHLPPKDEKNPHTSQQLQTLLVGVVLSLIAGMSGALIIFAWIIPGNYVEGGIVVSRGQNGGAALYTEPAGAIIRKIKNVSVDVFLKDKILENGYYTDTARVGSGVMLTSNGWGVFYASELSTLVNIPVLQIRDAQGTWYIPQVVVPDKKNGLVYFKLTGNEFYVTSFPDWRTLSSGLGVWSYTGREWRRESLGDLVQTSQEEVFIASDERVRFKLSPEGVVHSGLIFSDAGDLLGFVRNQGDLLDAWIIEYTIPTLLESGEISKTEITWKGSMVETFEAGKLVQGFLVDQTNKVAPDGVKSSDIIRAINGVPVSELTLYRLVREKQLKVTVWRDGKLSDILINN